MRHVAVTGAAGGLGREICHALGGLPQWEVRALYHAAGWDVTVPEQWDDLYADALVCCHAAPIGASFSEQLVVDLIGAYNACMAVLPGMAARQWGRIVLLGSIRAAHPRPSGQVAYAAAKAAVEGLARALACEYGRHGITVNVVAPGAVVTPRTTANIAAGTVSEPELLARTPAGRLCMPADVAAAVLWLLSDGAAMVNGETLHIDGGWSVSG